MKLSFKKDKKETGLARIGNPHSDTKIKVDGLVVGYIKGPNWRTDRLWTVRLARTQEPTQSDPAPFKWVQIRTKFDAESEARAFLKDGALERIVAGGLELYQFPKEKL